MKSIVATLLTLVTAATAFTSPAISTVSLQQRAARTSSLAAVIDIGSEDAFDKTIKKAGNGLVVVDYSTTWCGPCKGVWIHEYYCLTKDRRVQRRNDGEREAFEKAAVPMDLSLTPPLFFFFSHFAAAFSSDRSQVRRIF